MQRPRPNRARRVVEKALPRPHGSELAFGWNGFLLALLALLLSVAWSARAESDTDADPSASASSASETTPNAATASWPRFGGPAGNFHAPHGRIAEGAWTADGPRELWRLEIGPGYAAVVGDGGTEQAPAGVFAAYLDGERDALAAVDPADGTVRWRQTFANEPREANLVQFGRGPNATPLLLADRVITLGYNGELRALARVDGRLLWERDLVADYQAEIRKWGFSASPIAHAGQVLVPVGGEKHGMISVDPSTGETLWGGPPTSTSYASPIVIEVDGRAQLLYYAADGLVALDPATGALLWRHGLTNQWQNHSTLPVWGDDDLLFVVSQLESGARALRLGQGDGESSEPQVAWTSDQVQVHYWTSIRIGDTIYASIGKQGSVLAAIDVGSGKILWREKGYPHLNFVHTPDGTLALDADGRLLLLRLDPQGVEVAGAAELFESETWTPPSLIGARLYLRDQETLRAYALAGNETGQENPSTHRN